MAPSFDHGGEQSTRIKVHYSILINISSYCQLQEWRVIWTRIKREPAFQKFVISKQGLVYFTYYVLRKIIKNKCS